MKKLVSGILAGVGIMSSISGVSAMHFITSETKASESQSTSLNLKSALIGGGLVGAVSIPVTALISTLVGKNMKKSGNEISGPSNFKFAENKYDTYLEEFLNTENIRKEHPDLYVKSLSEPDNLVHGSTKQR